MSLHKHAVQLATRTHSSAAERLIRLSRESLGEPLITDDRIKDDGQCVAGR